MKCLLCLMFLLSAIAASSQEPAVPPPHDSQPLPRDEQPLPRSQRPVPGIEPRMPPDTAAPANTLSTEEVRAAIDDKLAGEPALRGTGIRASVTEKTVVLTGTVESDQQHELALRIASSYAGDREIVDDIETRTKL